MSSKNNIKSMLLFASLPLSANAGYLEYKSIECGKQKLAVNHEKKVAPIHHHKPAPVAKCDDMESNYFRLEAGIAASNTTSKIHFENYDPTLRTVKSRIKTSPIYGAAIGHNFDDKKAIELELNYIPYSNLKGSINRNAATTQQSENDDDSGDSETITTNRILNVSEKAKVQSISLFLNGKYNLLDQHEGFNPYILGGVGVSYNKIKQVRFSYNLASTLYDGTNPSGLTTVNSAFGNYKGKQRVDFAWQVGAGVWMPINSDVDFNINYKYMYLGKLKFKSMPTSDDKLSPSIDLRLRNSVIMAGVTFKL